MVDDADERSPIESPVALVTGAGRRVGNALARALAARGYRVALHAGNSLAGAQATANELTADGRQAIAVSADLADEDATRRMIDSVHGTFGRIDALVNNAAIWVPSRLEDARAADVRRHFEINTLGTFVCCQHVGLIMVAQAGGGAIVNVGDWATSRPYVDYAAYFASKGAIPTLTRTLAVELGTRNPRVRVNAVLPGPVLLPAGMSQAERTATINATLARRAGTPADLASAIFLLLENSFITGVCLPVDGGRSVYDGPSRR